MVRLMQSSASAPQRVRDRFRSKAQQFDDLYEDERPLVRLLRPGLFRRRQLAVDTVAAYREPRVLDVGCGSGRIGEFVLEAGASHYVGVDFSEPMIELARERLDRFGDRIELLIDDFLTAPVSGPFDVVLAPVNGAVLRFPHREPPSPFAAALDPDQAVIAASILGAKVTIPIHAEGYAVPGVYAPVRGATDAFMKSASALGVETHVSRPGERITL